MVHRIEHERPKDTEKSHPESHTNYRFLSSPEKTARLTNQHKHTRLMQQTINHMNAKIKKLIDNNGTELDDDMNRILVEDIEKRSPFVAASYEEGSFLQIFWETQQRAVALKDLRSMRWYPLIIRWCLYL